MHIILLLASVVALANAVRSEHGGADWRVFVWRAGLYSVGAAILIASGLALGLDLHALTLAACVAMVCCAVVETDLRWFIIPNVASIILVACALLLGRDHWNDAVWGAVLCGGLFLAVKMSFQLLRGIDGLGWGDVKFAAAMGALLGPVLSMSAVAAATIATSMLVLYPLMSAAQTVEVAGRPAAPLGVGLASAALGAFIAQQAGILS